MFNRSLPPIDWGESPLRNQYNSPQRQRYDAIRTDRRVLKAEVIDAEATVERIVHHTQDLCYQKERLRYAAPLKTLSREVLLKRGEDRLPPRFLGPLKVELEIQRQERQRQLSAWWRESMTAIGEMISKSMPLCRAQVEASASSEEEEERDRAPRASEVTERKHCDDGTIIDGSCDEQLLSSSPTLSQAADTTRPNNTSTAQCHDRSPALLPPLPVKLHPQRKYDALSSLLVGHPLISTLPPMSRERISIEIVNTMPFDNKLCVGDEN